MLCLAFRPETFARAESQFRSDHNVLWGIVGRAMEQSRRFLPRALHDESASPRSTARIPLANNFRIACVPGFPPRRPPKHKHACSSLTRPSLRNFASPTPNLLHNVDDAMTQPASMSIPRGRRQRPGAMWPSSLLPDLAVPGGRQHLLFDAAHLLERGGA